VKCRVNQHFVLEALTHQLSLPSNGNQLRTRILHLAVGIKFYLRN